jgi:hypothetical protein
MGTYSVKYLKIDDSIFFPSGITSGNVLTINSNGSTYWASPGAGSQGPTGPTGPQGQIGLTGATGASGISGSLSGTTNFLGLFTGATALGTSSIQQINDQIIFPQTPTVTPVITFAGSTGSGMVLNSTDILALVTNSSSRLILANSYVRSVAVHRLTNGSITSPGLTWNDKTSTGFWYTGTASDRIGVTIGGATAAIFGSTISIANQTYFNRGVAHTPVVNSSVSGTYQIDMSQSNIFNLTLTDNATLSTTNDAIGSYFLYVRQDGSGNRSLTLHADGRFLGATAVSIGTASNAISVIQLVCIGTQSVVTSQRNLIVL